MLTLLAKILKALNSEQSPAQLSLALCLALIMGFTPLFSLHNLLIIMLALWVRVNLTFFIISYPLFAMLGWLLSPWLTAVGEALLQNPSLGSFWESFYNTLPGRWSGFYYTGVSGGLVVGVILAIMLFPVFQWLIKKYRETLYQKIQKTRIMMWLKASKFWQVYERFSG